MIQVSWQELKKFAEARKIPIDHVEYKAFYHIFASDGGIVTNVCRIPKGGKFSPERKDFEDNYKNTTTSYTDTTGRLVVSTAIVPKGWSYHAPSFTFKTGTDNSLVFKNKFGEEIQGICELRFFKNKTEYLSFQTCPPAEATLTLVNFTPPYDYYIVSGEVSQVAPSITDAWIYGTLAPAIPYEIGGNREFICCKNLRFLKNKLLADGKAPKFVPYQQINETPPLFSNTIEVAVSHAATEVHEVEVSIGLYRL